MATDSGSLDSRVGVILAAASLAIAGGLSGQEPTTLRDLRSTGRVETESVASLSFHGVDVAPRIVAQVFALPDGRWAVADDVFDGEVPVFPAKGGKPSGTLGTPGN